MKLSFDNLASTAAKRLILNVTLEAHEFQMWARVCVCQILKDASSVLELLYGARFEMASDCVLTKRS